MKIIIYVLMAAVLSLMVFNALKLDFNALLEGESKTAVILILAGLCALVLLIILLISKRIERLQKNG